MADLKTLKTIDCCNDYLAIWIRPVNNNGVELPDSVKERINNEGVIIGVGPDVNKGSFHNYIGSDSELKIGDEVIVRSNKYTLITPKHGPYADERIILAHKPDLVYRHTRSEKSSYTFVDQWDKADTDLTALAN